MNDAAITVEGISKRYRIGQQIERYRTLRDALASAAISPVRLGQRLIGRNGHGPERTESIWALKDVSFEVRRGEALGLIGRNGAGKSTLLKILSRITEPTEGRARMRGHVGSLLEVGTGFHQELTGRENIYLSGAILGMRRTAIDRTFDAITEFAEIEKFVDTAIKHYSTGMYLRLAFAVAAHLEPEILLVDEVLAVGDAKFQKKCLGKMKDVTSDERTVLFVSHNMAAVEGLCDRVLWVDRGQLRMLGDPSDVISAYLSDMSRGEASFGGKQNVQVERVSLVDSRGQAASVFRPGDDLTVEVSYRSPDAYTDVYFRVFIGSELGNLFAADMLLDGEYESIRGRGTIACSFKRVPLLPGLYTVRLAILNRSGKNHLFSNQEVSSFHVIGDLADHGIEGELANTVPQKTAPMLLPYEWRMPDGTIRPVRIESSDLDYAELL